MSETSKKPLDLWVDEDQGDFRIRFRVERTLFSAESEFQKIDIVQTAGFGRMLFNDGVTMISERDEFVYHEMIAHVSMFVHPNVRRVLVIGGGDGGTVREVIRHPTVEYCRLVEIDPEVIRGCKEHIPLTSAALDDPRVEVAIQDGVQYVAGTSDRYDLVLVDSTDPIGPATPLFGPQFYRDVHRLLRDDGIVISQAESPFYFAREQRSLLEIVHGQFKHAYLYNYSNLTYPGGIWSFSIGIKGDRCPLGDFDPGRVAASGLEFRYYNPHVHRAAFGLPQFQAEALDGLLTPLRRE